LQANSRNSSIFCPRQLVFAANLPHQTNAIRLYREGISEMQHQTAKQKELDLAEHKKVS
jgi:hypothetical protein